MPLDSAKNLKKESLKIVHRWIDKFGTAYPKLKFADVCLNSSKNFILKTANEETLVFFIFNFLFFLGRKKTTRRRKFEKTSKSKYYN